MGLWVTASLEPARSLRGGECPLGDTQHGQAALDPCGPTGLVCARSERREEGPWETPSDAPWELPLRTVAPPEPTGGTFQRRSAASGMCRVARRGQGSLSCGSEGQDQVQSPVPESRSQASGLPRSSLQGQTLEPLPRPGPSGGLHAWAQAYHGEEKASPPARRLLPRCFGAGSACQAGSVLGSGLRAGRQHAGTWCAG